MTATSKTIRELRDERQWRPEEMVSKIGGDTARLRHAEIVGPDLAMLTAAAKAFGMAPEDIALPRHMRLVTVQGYRLHLATLRNGARTVQARVSGFDPSGGRGKLARGPDPDHPEADSPMVFMTPLPGEEEKWRETAPTDKEALDALERRITEAMSLAMA